MELDIENQNLDLNENKNNESDTLKNFKKKFTDEKNKIKAYYKETTETQEVINNLLNNIPKTDNLIR